MKLNVPQRHISNICLYIITQNKYHWHWWWIKFNFSGICCRHITICCSSCTQTAFTAPSSATATSFPLSLFRIDCGRICLCVYNLRDKRTVCHHKPEMKPEKTQNKENTATNKLTTDVPDPSKHHTKWWWTSKVIFGIFSVVVKLLSVCFMHNDNNNKNSNKVKALGCKNRIESNLAKSVKSYAN